MNGRRGHAPMRMRRRQSDAKWRASVASCYETLKFVIPNQKSLPKRKTSKALVLQETEKHIGELEKTISCILNIDAQEQGQGVLWKRGHHWSPATLDDIRLDFAEKQRRVFHQSSQGRRCYNLLHDIQDEILTMSADPSSMAFVPLKNCIGEKSTKDVSTCTSKRPKVSKVRCRFETERACQKLLLSFKTGDIVRGVVPGSTSASACASKSDAQEVPSMSLPLNQNLDRIVNLEKIGNIFVSTEDFHQFSLREDFDLQSHQQHETEQQQIQNVQEVPVMVTPSKPYGIARHDVMMSQQFEATDVFNTSLLGYSTPVKGRDVAHSERATVPCSPGLTNVCKQLNFNNTTPETPHMNYQNASYQYALSSYISTTANTDCTPVQTNPITASTGFTPIKLPMESYVPVSPLLSPNPAWNFGDAMDASVPQMGISDIEDGDGENHNLLCMENFDADDGVDKICTKKTTSSRICTSTPKTPESTKKVCRRKRNPCAEKEVEADPAVMNRPRAKCCKRLEDLYEKPSLRQELTSDQGPIIAGVLNASLENSDFDGYLFYYHQVAPELKKHLGDYQDYTSLAALVSDMWTRLPCDDRHTMVTLAALENQDSNSSASGNLSQDLEGLDVKPLGDCN